MQRKKVDPGRIFRDYAALGDDVIITDPVYAKYVERLGVDISYLKSRISDTGCIEFANKFLVDGLKKDISPISVRSLMNPYAVLGELDIVEFHLCPILIRRRQILGDAMQYGRG